MGECKIGYAFIKVDVPFIDTANQLLVIRNSARGARISTDLTFKAKVIDADIAGFIQRGVMELRSRAWSRENLMRCAPNQITLMQMLAPDWTDWGWKVDPKFLEEARSIWGLKAA